MSTWTTPATWANAAVTAAQMNTEIRDHALFLKGALDIISNSTTADTSDTMNLWIKRAAAGNSAYSASVTADSNARFTIGADGALSWGPGSAGIDTNLYRGASNTLYTDDGLLFNGTSGITLGGNIIEFTERTDPAAGGANTARLYAKDNGAGKTLLVVVFNTGAVQTIATQP